jgi:hypothetical protein
MAEEKVLAAIYRGFIPTLVTSPAFMYFGTLEIWRTARYMSKNMHVNTTYQGWYSLRFYCFAALITV